MTKWVLPWPVLPYTFLQSITKPRLKVLFLQGHSKKNAHLSNAPEPIIADRNRCTGSLIEAVQAASHLCIHNCSPLISITHNHSSAIDIPLASNAFFTLSIDPVQGLPLGLIPWSDVRHQTKLSSSPDALLPFSLHVQTIAILPVLLSRPAAWYPPFSCAPPHSSLNPSVLHHTYFSDTSSPLHAVSSSLQPPYSKFQLHKVLLVPLFLHTTFSWHSLKVTYTNTFFIPPHTSPHFIHSMFYFFSNATIKKKKKFCYNF